ncbi:MAG: response regulator [Planctomycetota bacterium]|jgi:two-component system chemotaxis response regulator CheY
MKVLVVDDSAVMRRILIRTLSGIGIIHIDQASDGKQAVNAVMEGSYDLVLMDWNLPNMPGIEAVKSIRSKGLSVPIVMVTSNMQKNHVVEALKAGVTYYFIKPFKGDEFVEKIQEILKLNKR